MTCDGIAVYEVHYEVNLLEACAESADCQIKDQLQAIAKTIKNIGEYGNCTVDEVTTEQTMLQLIENSGKSIYLFICCMLSLFAFMWQV